MMADEKMQSLRYVRLASSGSPVTRVLALRHLNHHHHHHYPDEISSKMEVAPKAIRGWDGLDPAIEPCSANDENIALLGDSHDDINHLCGDDDDDDDSVVATA